MSSYFHLLKESFWKNSAIFFISKDIFNNFEFGIYNKDLLLTIYILYEQGNML